MKMRTSFYLINSRGCSHRAKPSDISAVDCLIAYLLETGALTPEMLRTFRPSVCNRLDRNTSGILAAGKSLAGLQELSLFFKERSIEKYYLCPVIGHVEQGERIAGNIHRKTVKQTVCRCRKSPVRSLRDRNRVSSGVGEWKTDAFGSTSDHGKDTSDPGASGKALGHPLLGDFKYGNLGVNERYKKQYGLEAQLLHAYRLRMPETDGVLKNISGREFRAPLPDLFARICKEEKLTLPEGLETR